ncbi:carbohydrate ABC transporter permease [Fervidibacillus albus]|uniref:Sugar ABC transporter permease n=1 Tax=Fervidibacillus albus TaxID=2980026 RepID=A0A9E8LXD9_9BACI|nr:sugar ABC transporter permease [Fervidibacillus albus]WAA10539.1 sugar ABC transporter permease [Fervidibacillus albus]
MKKWILPYMMLTPFLLLVILFFVTPVIITTVMAFTNMDYMMEWNFIGLQNFEKIVSDPNFVQIVTNTFVYVGATLLINVCFALLLALLSSYYIPYEKSGLFFRALWMLPRITPPVVYVLLWLWIFDASEYGLLNTLTSFFSSKEPIAWLIDHPMTAIILVNGMVGASFGMIIFSSAIQSIPRDLFKAAQVDGASEWSVFKDIILPSIKWPIMFVSVWQLLSLLTSYEYILLLTDGGPVFESEVWALYAYHKAFKNLEFGYGSALSLILVIIAIGLTGVVLKLFKFNSMIQSSRIE